MNTAAHKGHHYQLFILACCILALVALAIEALVPLDEGTRQILNYADTGVCAVFFADFVVSLGKAQRRWHYFYRWGWIDLVSSIPVFHVFRWGRFVRVVRIFRILRGVRATKIIASFILDRRAESAFLAAALLSTLFLISASIAILHLEKSVPGANITTPEDALWWACTTITTVGYGDRYPITTEGRVVAALLMLAGVGLFGTLAGCVAAWFLSPAEKKQKSDLEEIRSELRELRRVIERVSEKNSDEVERAGQE
jgi:voltage-gated potassium channel